MNFFINGWGSTAAVWQDLATPGDFCYDISCRENYADLLSEFNKAWQKNNCQPLTLSGWSLGSLLALELAVKAPEKIDCIFLFGATAHFADCEESACQKPVIVKNMLRRLHHDPQKTVTDFFTLMFSPSESTFLSKFLAQFNVPSNEKALSYGLSYLLHADMKEKLPQINIPATIIHGSKDSICPLAAAQYLADNLPHSKLTVFNDCGHLPFFTRKDDCYKLIRKDK